MRLQQSAGFNKWVPFHGSSTKDTQGQLEEQATTPDVYVTRASLLPIWNMTGAYTHNPALNFDEYRRNLAIWKQNNHLLTKDFFQLSPWHGNEDTSGWTVFAYNDPASGEGILLAFREETCQDPEFTVSLPFAQKGCSYSVTDDDSQKQWIADGSQLASGITLTLPAPHTSLLWHISRQ